MVEYFSMIDIFVLRYLLKIELGLTLMNCWYDTYWSYQASEKVFVGFIDSKFHLFAVSNAK